MKSKKIPKFLQGVLWSCPVDKLDLEKDKVYIINQVLSLGTLPMLQWLFVNYHPSTISQVFLNQPIRDYTASRFNLLKDYLLPLYNHPLVFQKYVRDFLSDSRPRQESDFW